MLRTLQWMHTHPPQEIAAKMPKPLRGEDDALYVEALRQLDADVLDRWGDAGRRRRGRSNVAGGIDGEGQEGDDRSVRTYTNEFVTPR